MQSVSEEYTWLLGGFDAGDGQRGFFSSTNVDRLYIEDKEDLSIYRIDGKKLISLTFSESNSMYLSLFL